MNTNRQTRHIIGFALIALAVGIIYKYVLHASKEISFFIIIATWFFLLLYFKEEE